MTKITCIITDDEPLARKGLEAYVQRVPFLELATVCEDAIQLNTVLQQRKVDLLFLDIEMPYLSGIDLIKTLREPPKVIFTTAYENYALQGYELDVLDYLLKPISFDRFLKAANKAADYFNAGGANAKEYVFIKVDGRLEKVRFQDILFVQALENYVAIQTPSRRLLTHATLKSVLELLPPGFVQTHKSWIVNCACVDSIEGNTLKCGSYEVPLSKYTKEDVLEKIVNGQLLKRNTDPS